MNHPAQRTTWLGLLSAARPNVQRVRPNVQRVIVE